MSNPRRWRRPACWLAGHKYFSSGVAGYTCDRCWKFFDRSDGEPAERDKGWVR